MCSVVVSRSQWQLARFPGLSEDDYLLLSCALKVVTQRKEVELVLIYFGKTSKEANHSCVINLSFSLVPDLTLKCQTYACRTRRGFSIRSLNLKNI